MAIILDRRIMVHTHTLYARGASDYKEIKTGGPHQTASNTQDPLWGTERVSLCVCVSGKIQGRSGKQKKKKRVYIKK